MWKKIKKWFSLVRYYFKREDRFIDYFCDIPRDNKLTIKDLSTFCTKEPTTLEELADYIIPYKDIIRINGFDYRTLLLHNDIECFSKKFEQYKKEMK